MMPVAVAPLQSLRHVGKTSTLRTHISKNEMWGTRLDAEDRLASILPADADADAGDDDRLFRKLCL